MRRERAIGFANLRVFARNRKEPYSLRVLAPLREIEDIRIERKKYHLNDYKTENIKSQPCHPFDGSRNTSFTKRLYRSSIHNRRKIAKGRDQLDARLF